MVGKGIEMMFLSNVSWQLVGYCLSPYMLLLNVEHSTDSHYWKRNLMPCRWARIIILNYCSTMMWEFCGSDYLIPTVMHKVLLFAHVHFPVINTALKSKRILTTSAEWILMRNEESQKKELCCHNRYAWYIYMSVCCIHVYAFQHSL